MPFCPYQPQEDIKQRYILYLGDRWRIVINIKPRSLYLRRLGGTQKWSGPSGEEKILFPLPGFEPDRPARCLVTTSTKLSRFRDL